MEKAHQASSAVGALSEQLVRGVRLRYEAFFGAAQDCQAWSIDT
jgi:hypothetical protein